MSALPDHMLNLQTGFIVMLLRILDPKNRHVNRTNKDVNLTLSQLSCGPADDSFHHLWSDDDNSFPALGFNHMQSPTRFRFSIPMNKE